jgi:hypothetical protein
MSAPSRRPEIRRRRTRKENVQLRKRSGGPRLTLIARSHSKAEWFEFNSPAILGRASRGSPPHLPKPARSSRRFEAEQNRSVDSRDNLHSVV